MKKISLIAFGALVLSASGALANTCAVNPNLPQCNVVPEIDAAAGVAALAAVGAGIALLRERFKR